MAEESIPQSTPQRHQWTDKKCSCPIYCPKCGRHRSRDRVGHYCKTRNCQYATGYPACELLPHDPEERRAR